MFLGSEKLFEGVEPDEKMDGCTKSGRNTVASEISVAVSRAHEQKE